MSNCQGWLNIYKPQGISSFAVIKKIRKKFNINHIGHAGTLDPLAEGILPIAVGKTTKLIKFINHNIKEYEFIVKWGEQTSTDDAEGKIIAKSNMIPSFIKIKKALSSFNGAIMQKPPKASAIKINGKRAYKLFRENKDFNINEKEVFIYSSKVTKNKNNLFTNFSLKCGKGFYIRSFARDIAEKLNTKAHISALKRTQVGKFNIKNANLLDDLLKIRQRLSEFKGLYKSASMLDDILAYEIDDEKEIKNISQGKAIKVNLNQLLISPLILSDEKIVFLTDNGNVISFGKLEGDLYKPEKVLI